MAGGMPEDTRVVGRLPGLEIEIRHRKEAGAEMLAVSLKGVPDLDAVAAVWLDPWRLALAFNPWLGPWIRPWLGTWTELCRPWSGFGQPPAAAAQDRDARRDGDDGAARR